MQLSLTLNLLCDGSLVLELLCKWRSYCWGSGGRLQADGADTNLEEDINITNHQEELLMAALSRCTIVGCSFTKGDDTIGGVTKGDDTIGEGDDTIDGVDNGQTVFGLKNWHLTVPGQEYIEKGLGKEAHCVEDSGRLTATHIVSQFLDSLCPTQSVTATDFERLVQDLHWLQSNLEKFRLSARLVSRPFAHNYINIM